MLSGRRPTVIKVIAVLGHYLPAIDYRQHAMIYSNIILNKKLSILEQGAWFLTDELIMENLSNSTLQLLRKGGCILCTFHTDPYRMISHLLIKMGVAVTLAIGKKVIAKKESGLSNYTWPARI